MKTFSFFCGSIAFVSLAACTSTAPEKSGAVSISFPSTNAAIATDNVQLTVYDASVKGNDCLSLVQTVQKAQPPPKPIYDSGNVDTCVFFQSQVKPFDMDYGTRSFLVVGQRKTGGTAANFMIGCTIAGIGDVSNSVDVSLSDFDSTAAVPESTKCASLGDRCTKKLTCY